MFCGLKENIRLIKTFRVGDEKKTYGSTKRVGRAVS